MKDRGLRESMVHRAIPWSEKGGEGRREKGSRREQVRWAVK